MEIKNNFARLRQFAADNKARAVCAVLAAGPALAMAADPTTAEEGITQAKTTILAIVALAGAALIVVSLAGVGWRLGAKWIGRLGSKG